MKERPSGHRYMTSEEVFFCKFQERTLPAFYGRPGIIIKTINQVVRFSESDSPTDPGYVCIANYMYTAHCSPLSKNNKHVCAGEAMDKRNF